MQGGARPGAGRKKGSTNRIDRVIKQRALVSGYLPLEMLLDISRYHHARALKLRDEKPTKARTKAAIQADLRIEHSLVQAAADKAAPYLHPRLATLQSNVNLTGRLTLEELVTQSIPAPANSNAVEEKDGIVSTQG